jgi:hypothetical protein
VTYIVHDDGSADLGYRVIPVPRKISLAGAGEAFRAHLDNRR